MRIWMRVSVRVWLIEDQGEAKDSCVRLRLRVKRLNLLVELSQVKPPMALAPPDNLKKR